MDLDGVRGYKGALTMEERRRRSDSGLYAYYGQPGHVLATCAFASCARQACGTYLHLLFLPSPESAAVAAPIAAAAAAVAIRPGILSLGTLQPVTHLQFSPTQPSRGHS